jgi:hypothetical protein
MEMWLCGGSNNDDGNYDDDDDDGDGRDDVFDQSTQTISKRFDVQQINIKKSANRASGMVKGGEKRHTQAYLHTRIQMNTNTHAHTCTHTHTYLHEFN